MRPTNKFAKAAFTLIELAIVLAVAGVLFAGLWRLMSGANQSQKNNAAGADAVKIMNAYKAYTLSPSGQTFIAALSAGGTASLGIPDTAPHASDGTTANTGCKGYLTANPEVCDYLPVGFYAGTTNPYNQTYLAPQVLKDGATAAGTTANYYSIMLLTTGGDTIQDGSGGQVIASIGGDGGFIYSSAVCGGAAANACGAYGTWYANPTSYGFAAATRTGHIAMRSFVSQTQDTSAPWLERKVFLPDTASSLNTMTAKLYIDPASSGIYMNSLAVPSTTGASLFMSSATATSGGGNINMAGGNINLVAVGSTTGGGNINLMGGQIADTQTSSTYNGSINIKANMTYAAGTTPPNSILTLGDTAGTPCTRSSYLKTGGTLTCQWLAQFSGDIEVSGVLQANSLFADTFYYQTSDIRLKTDIKALHDSLDDIMKLKPVSYKLKSNGAYSLGFIAQDLEKVYPELVGQVGDIKGVNYTGVIAPLVGDVQQLKHDNDDMREEIRAEKARIKDLERRLEQQSK